VWYNDLVQDSQTIFAFAAQREKQLHSELLSVKKFACFASRQS
jgi:Holliday junction resolvasome RuvABC DNA-binding subunit